MNLRQSRTYLGIRHHDSGVSPRGACEVQVTYAGSISGVTYDYQLAEPLTGEVVLFDWGYSDGGTDARPYLLAMALLTDVLGGQRASKLSDLFRSAMVARFPYNGWRLSSEQIEAWAELAEAERIAAPVPESEPLDQMSGGMAVLEITRWDTTPSISNSTQVYFKGSGDTTTKYVVTAGSTVWVKLPNGMEGQATLLGVEASHDTSHQVLYTYRVEGYYSADPVPNRVPNRRVREATWDEAFSVRDGIQWPTWEEFKAQYMGDWK